MEILGVIPARGGSKGVPGKNLRLLAGRPLLAYTADAALGSRRLSRTVLSTDDPEIAAAGRALGLVVPFLRPAALAADDTPMLPVLVHTVEALRREGFAADAVVLLQPTSPLRTAADVDAALDLLEATGADSVVSVVEVPHQFSPVSVMSIENGRLRPFLSGPAATRRQDKPRVFARNGPAVLAVRAASLARGSLYGDDCRPLLMDPESSVDIDGPADFAYAEYLLSQAPRPSRAPLAEPLRKP
jgi:CMP-N,N'-diacetyllegionaminic acid synthase